MITTNTIFIHSTFALFTLSVNILVKHNTLNQCNFTLAQRRKRWTNIKPALGQSLVLAGL